MLQAAEEACCCDTTMWLPWDSLTRDHRNVLILPISLSFGRNFFFLLFLLVSLSFCMSFSLSFYPFLACASIAFPLVPFLGCMLIGREGGDLGAVHTDMTICHWHTGQCKQWEQCMWQNEKVRGGGSEAPPLPTYTWDFTYDYIHKTLLPWQQVFSYLGTRPFQCRNSSLKSLPALPCF